LKADFDAYWDRVKKSQTEKPVQEAQKLAQAQKPERVASTQSGDSDIRVKMPQVKKRTPLQCYWDETSNKDHPSKFSRTDELTDEAVRDAVERHLD